MIRIGIIGAGPMGGGNARALARHSQRCRISIVADPSTEAAAKLAAEVGGRPVADYAAALDDMDAAVIATPNWLHTEQAIACARAGKHVFIEKPMALSTADADRIVAAVTQARVASLVGFSVRFEGIFNTMRQMVRAGRIGELYSIWSRRIGGWAAGQGWRSEYSRSGGVMNELLVHEIDWMVDLAGMPRSVYCRKHSRQQTDPRDNEHIWLMLAFGGVSTGTIEGSQMAAFSDYYRGCIGTTGSLSTRDWGRELHLQTSPRESQKVDLGPAFDKHANFLDAIEGVAPSAADAAYGRSIVHIAQKAIESAVSGSVVSLDL
jgi:predicted dehydrogenase